MTFPGSGPVSVMESRPRQRVMPVFPGRKARLSVPIGLFCLSSLRTLEEEISCLLYRVLEKEALQKE